MLSYEGYFEEGRFYPLEQTETMQGRHRAFITILDEPPHNSNADAWDDFFAAVEQAKDEPVPEFVRSCFHSGAEFDTPPTAW